ncbi:hypothetical protein [Aliarcobacter cryaerophilus]|uniref:hypothetical protein n=1 Tax=Aliarcobacter cryaerophilus TaxID=28198 RepID=UPI003DA24BA6
MKDEFDNLKTDKKTWIYWNSSLEDKNTVVRIIQSILTQEQNAEISPINEYMRHTFKAFAYFVNKTLDTSVNKIRFGEDIGEIKKEISLEIDNKLYELHKQYYENIDFKSLDKNNPTTLIVMMDSIYCENFILIDYVKRNFNIVYFEEEIL